jgi:hypothetical protein
MIKELIQKYLESKGFTDVSVVFFPTDRQVKEYYDYEKYLFSSKPTYEIIIKYSGKGVHSMRKFNVDPKDIDNLYQILDFQTGTKRL